MARRKPVLVSLIGMDGSGKTTHAKTVIQCLRDRGMPAKYIWLGPRPFLLAPLRLVAHRTILKNESIRCDYASYLERRQTHVSKWSFLSKVYYSVALLDYLILVNWSLWSFLFRRSNIVCDRYIYDIVINLGDILNYSKQDEAKLIRRLSAFFPQPDLVIVCDVDEEVALQRKSDTPHISYLNTCRPKYRYLAKCFNFPVVDTSLSLETTTAQVWQIVAEHIKARNED